MLAVGLGTRTDPVQAYEWLLRAAIQGHALARYNAGYAHLVGEGVSKDPAAAVDWWRQAAEQELAVAQFALGWTMMIGMGTPSDAEAGAKWLRRAAGNGDPTAASIVAAMDAGQPVGTLTVHLPRPAHHGLSIGAERYAIDEMSMSAKRRDCTF